MMRIYHPAYILCLSLLFNFACSSDEPEGSSSKKTTEEVIATPTPKPTPVQPVDLGEGLSYLVLKSGSGAREIKQGDECLFDVLLSTAQGEEIWTGDFEFTIGAGQAIEGFDRGCRGMKREEKRKINVPSALGYGSEGLEGDPPIQPNQDLVFEITFIDFTNKKESN